MNSKISKLFLFSLLFPCTVLAQPAGGEVAKDGCQQMKAQCKELRFKMQEQDEQLRDKLNRMKDSQGEEKIELMEELLDDLITSRIAMHDKMSVMHEEMMECRWAGEGTRMGRSGGGKKSDARPGMKPRMGVEME